MSAVRVCLGPRLIIGISAGTTVTSVNDPDLTGELAATTSDTSTTTAIAYQLTDPQGNVLGTVNPSDPDEIVDPIVTDEFGNITTITGAASTGPRYGWLGGAQRDSASLGGVVLMGDRGYLPTVGRFVSVDSVFDGSANPYDYCDQDPVYLTDPEGTGLPGPFKPSHHPLILITWVNTLFGDGANAAVITVYVVITNTSWACAPRDCDVEAKTNRFDKVSHSVNNNGLGFDYSFTVIGDSKVELEVKLTWHKKGHSHSTSASVEFEGSTIDEGGAG